MSFDADGHPEAATGAIAVANKMFWALGYWQVENHLVIDRRATQLDDRRQGGVHAGVRTQAPDGDARPRRRCCDARIAAPMAATAPSPRAPCSGRPIGGFKYYGTRPDDPNDVVPHEHRRELRALKVFGAWTNLVDMKAGNTLDAVVVENGRSVVRHYLQDVGSTFGTGANGPREYDEGWELLYDGALLRKRLFTLGFFIAPWQTVDYNEHAVDRPLRRRCVRSAGRGGRGSATAALRHARADDTFWAARRVAAFSDEMIRAAVRTGEYSDPAAEALLTDVLIKRRQKIAAAYLPAINPLVDFALVRGRARELQQCRGRRRRGRRAGRRLSRRVVGVRQRHRRHARDRTGRHLAADHAGGARPVAAGRRHVRAHSRLGGRPGARRVGAAGRRILPADADRDGRSSASKDFHDKKSPCAQDQPWRSRSPSRR